MKQINHFSENLTELIVENEFTQKSLANALGTTQQTVSRWRQGINEPDLDMLIRLCYYLKTTPNEILGYNEEDVEILETILDQDYIKEQMIENAEYYEDAILITNYKAPKNDDNKA